jgi:Mg/Co/Ni transporter MgtE
MSRRAAARLEGLGYQNVCVYVAGKQDWLAFGLPFEGELAESETAGTIAHREVPTCSMGEKIGDVHARIRTSGWEECVVVNDDRIVLGLVAGEMWQHDAALPVEQVMDLAPLTFRPYYTKKLIVERMQKQSANVALVTTAEGRLVGLLRKNELK